MSEDPKRAPQIGASGRAYLLLTLTALCWAGNAVLGRLAVGEISPMALVSLRWFGALGLLVVFAHAQVRRDWPVMRQRLLFIAVMAGEHGVGCTRFPGHHTICARSRQSSRSPPSAVTSSERFHSVR